MYEREIRNPEQRLYIRERNPGLLIKSYLTLPYTLRITDWSKIRNSGGFPQSCFFGGGLGPVLNNI